MSWFFPENYMWDLAASIAVNSGGALGEVNAVTSRLEAASAQAAATGAGGLR